MPTTKGIVLRRSVKQWSKVVIPR